MSELQGVSYARNILLSVLRGKEQQDAACAVSLQTWWLLWDSPTKRMPSCTWKYLLQAKIFKKTTFRKQRTNKPVGCGHGASNPGGESALPVCQEPS
jgi:hypothetical protein